MSLESELLFGRNQEEGQGKGEGVPIPKTEGVDLRQEITTPLKGAVKKMPESFILISLSYKVERPVNGLSVCLCFVYIHVHVCVCFCVYVLCFCVYEATTGWWTKSWEHEPVAIVR